jgi:hypothetical protein
MLPGTKLPDAVQVGIHRIPVRVVENLTNDNEELCWGYYDPVKREISLCTTLFEQPEAYQLSVAWHEALHALCSCLRMSVEHADIGRLADGIVGVLLGLSREPTLKKKASSFPGTR